MTYSRAFFLIARAAVLVQLPLALSFSPSIALAKQEPPPRLTVRLDYRLGPGTSSCPTERSVRSWLNKFFAYDVVESTVGASFGLAINRMRDGKAYETVLTISDEAGRILWSEVAHSSIRKCVDLVMDKAFILQMMAIDYLHPPSTPSRALPPDPAPSPEPPVPVPAPTQLGPVLSWETPAPVAPTPLPTVSRGVLPEGFIFGGVLSLSYGLMPTASFGGTGLLMYRKGDWSGALGVRMERGLVPAYYRQTSIDSLFAGVTLLLPCVSRGAFTGCLVTETGGFAFSAAIGAPVLDGAHWLLAGGLRGIVEQRISDHLVAHAFAQFSGIPVGTHLFTCEKDLWRSPPGFGGIGFGLLVTP